MIRGEMSKITDIYDINTEHIPNLKYNRKIKTSQKLIYRYKYIDR